MIALLGTVIEVHIENDRCQEEPGTGPRSEQVRMLAYPAEAGELGPGLLHDRTGVDVVSPGGLWTDLPDTLVEAPHGGAEHFVVFVAPRVARHPPESGVLGGVVSSSIVACQHQHGAGAGNDDARFAAAIGVALQPCHLAVQPAAQPLPQAWCGVEGGHRRGRAAVESFLAGGLADRSGQACASFHRARV